MSVLLLILSALGILIGFFFMSEATTGVGIIGIAGVLAIWARIAQAGDNHKKMMAEIEKLAPAAKTTPPE